MEIQGIMILGQHWQNICKTMVVHVYQPSYVEKHK
jgi:hypothetical protein